MTKEELKPSDRSSDFVAVLLTSYQQSIRCAQCKVLGVGWCQHKDRGHTFSNIQDIQVNGVLISSSSVTIGR